MPVNFGFPVVFSTKVVAVVPSSNCGIAAKRVIPEPCVIVAKPPMCGPEPPLVLSVHWKNCHSVVTLIVEVLTLPVVASAIETGLLAFSQTLKVLGDPSDKVV